jgi:DNA polymerase elongation subunit (family B)
MVISGWIFDAYPVAQGISLWVLDEHGRMHTFLDRWQPRLFVQDEPRLSRFLSKTRIAIDQRLVERRDFFTHQPRRVREIRVRNPLQYNDLVNGLQEIENLELFNCDIHPVQSYHYERGHFPLGRCEFEADAAGVLRAWELKDSPWAIDYDWPPLRFACLTLDHAADPNHARKGGLVLTLGARPDKDSSYLLEETEPGEVITTLNQQIAAWDPDVILSDWGDSYILPRLRQMSAQSGIPLKLSRDPNRSIAGRGSRSFFTYGRTIYQGGAQYLFGRWHLDVLNSFTIGETDLDGLFEIARIAKLPVQRAARCTIGTSLSSMQLDVADRDGTLVPLHKQQTEDFRDGMSLLVADKGGIVYAPELGWHEDIAEVDFVSMYPAIMVKYNISPETVNCECCKPTADAGRGMRDSGVGKWPFLIKSSLPSPASRIPHPASVVPEVGHHLCTRVRGLVPRVLENILLKRGEYKRLAKTISDPRKRLIYKRRYTAHKWALVTCFGYLGFKNARFGKIEAHECVSAYGREVLLRAKDIAEREGFHMVHAIVDSMWVKKPGATAGDFQALADMISREMGFPIGLEGVYKWLRFCPSKQDHALGVPNRYFGCFENGELKIRGIELRRQDTPPLFKRFQQEVLDCLAEAHNLAECRALAGRVEAIYDAYRDRIASGQVSLEDLAFTSSLSKEPSEYVHDTYSSIAARQLAASGITLHAGETIQYVITSAKEKVRDWRVMPLVLAVNYGEYDPAKYLELLERAYVTLAEGLVPGVPLEPAPRSSKKRREATARQGLLFG